MNMLNAAFKEIFKTDRDLISDNDPRAAEIQRDLDQEHARVDRARRQTYFPPGTVAPRTLSEATDLDGNFKTIV